MKTYLSTIALAAAIAFVSMPGSAHAGGCVTAGDAAGTPCASDDNPCTDDECNGANLCLHTPNTDPCEDDDICTAGNVCAAGVCGTMECTELTAAGKNGGFFRMRFPETWDGDLVIVNHGFDLNDRKIRHHNVCSNNEFVSCTGDAECGSGNFCNDISMLGLDQLLVPMGKAVAASTYAKSGWAVFRSAKDLKDMIKFVKKHETFGSQLERVIVTGFSLGGAVTADATLKLKIDGAVPLCGAVAGGLPTWDVAQDVRNVYDYLCDDVIYTPGFKGSFDSEPDVGEVNSNSPDDDAVDIALTVDSCLGIIGFAPHVPEMDTRLTQFLELTDFAGYQGPEATLNLISAIGFATLGLGDFVRDEGRLDGKRIGWNSEPDLDYSVIGSNAPLAVDFDAGVERLTKGVPGRKLLSKASNPDFTRGKGAKVDYPILSMAGAADWLVIPEFERVYTTALETGDKDYTQTWIDTFGHCVFSEQEVTAVFNSYFEWLGPVEGPRGTQPSKEDVEAECLSLPGGVQGDTCNFNNAFEPGYVADRIPARGDWPLAATPTAP